VFPVRYGLDSYILFRRNSVFKGLILNTRKGNLYGPVELNKGFGGSDPTENLRNYINPLELVIDNRLRRLQWLGPG
jgi:hypothetical protein